MSLDEPYRSTVLWRYLDGWDVAQIASHEAVSEAAVRKRLSRALAELRIRLNEQFEGKRDAWSVALAGLIRGGQDELAGTAVVVASGALLMKKWIAASVAGLIVLLGVFVLQRTLEPPAGPSSSEDASATVLSPANIGERLASDVGHEDASTPRVAVEETTATPAALRITGTVFDLPYPDSSQPPRIAAGIEVSANLIGNLENVGVPPTVLTDAEGRFQLELPGSTRSSFHLQVHAKGDERHRPKGSTIQLKPGDSVPEQRLERAAHGDLYGVVSDAEGKGMSGVVVQCSRQGAPALETTSDQVGAFAFHNLYTVTSFYPGSPSLTVEASAYRLIPPPPASPLKTGGWRDTRLTLVRAGGKLVVHVEDALGKPVPDVEIGVEISQAEPEVRHEPWEALRPRGNTTEKTDASGMTVLGDVWTERKLKLFASFGRRTWTVERAVEGRVELGHPEKGSAIVVAADKPGELRLVLPRSIRLRGSVIDVDGVPLAHATVFLRPIGRAPRELTGFSPLRTDTAGQFEQELVRPSDACVVALLAGSTPQSFDAWGADQMQMIEGVRTAQARVEVGPQSPDELSVELVLQATLKITGRVLEMDGSPCKGWIAALPAEETWRRGSSRGSGVQMKDDGSFELAALLPGRYALEVKPHRHYVFTDCLLPQRFEWFEAGASEVVVKLQEERAVEVTLEVNSPKVQVDSMTVAIGMLVPYEPLDPFKYEIERERRFDGLSGWDEDATLDFGGQTGAIGKRGTTGFLHVGGDAPVHRLRPMAEGWYTIGIDARDRQGERVHPCGTGLVYLRAGPYRLHFDLRPQTQVNGRIDAEHADLWLGLVDEAGKPVQVMRTSRHLDEVVPIGAGGRFVLDGAPVGTFRLRVGDEAELRAGRFRHEQPITIHSEANPAIEIRLP